MADVTGPISTLPGSRHALPEGTKCDNHPDRDAVARVQGETDSMGSEMNDLCADCLSGDREAAAEDRCGRCDWCKNAVTDLANARDYDEGTCGPVYSVCGKCREKQAKSLEEELADYDDDDDYYDDEEDFDCHLMDNGQCMAAGSEDCDWNCPYRDSEHFAGSKAWMRAKGSACHKCDAEFEDGQEPGHPRECGKCSVPATPNQ
jgi:hypothetical protein